MNIKIKIFVISTFFLLISPLVNVSANIENSEEPLNEVIINIAQYPQASLSDITLSMIFQYTWKTQDTIYKFNIREITVEEAAGEGDKPLNIENYDVLIVGANYWSYLTHGLNEKLQQNIKQFLSDGGGYLGSCAGTTFASMGFENPEGVFEKAANKGVLGIVNVYANEDYFGESQYCSRSISALPPINLKVESDNTNPIFNPYTNSHINMTYGGGPGMYEANNSDSKLGEIVPLLTFDEELMETKPINWHLPILPPLFWLQYEKVKTDLLGQYAAIATTYNNTGRIVIFSPHAEIPLYVNGTMIEYRDKRNTYSSIGKLRQFVYYWNGTKMNESYNYWMHRRSVAWLAGVTEEDLPPYNQLRVFIDKPECRLEPQLYINDTKIIYLDEYGTLRFNYPLLGEKFDSPLLKITRFIFRNRQTLSDKLGIRIIERILAKEGRTIVVDDITFDIYTENCQKVEFYVDDILKHTDYESPFEYKIEKNTYDGVHTVEVRGYDEYGNYAYETGEYTFKNR